MSSDSVSNSSESSIKRREIRRRRILDNSEDRFKKLMGYGSKEKSLENTTENHMDVPLQPPKASSQVSIGRESTIPLIEQTETVTAIPGATALSPTVHESDSPVDDWMLDENNFQNAENKPSRLSQNLDGNVFERNLGVMEDEELDEDWPQGEPHPLDRVADCGELPEDDDSSVERSLRTKSRDKRESSVCSFSKEQLQQQQQEIAEFHIFRQKMFLVVGLLVRLSFLFSFGQEYVQSLFNPFAALEIAVIGYQRALGIDLGLNTRGGLWMSALIMSGVKPEIIHNYKTTMGAFSAAADDFTVYFFAFICLHLFLGLFV